MSTENKPQVIKEINPKITFETPVRKTALLCLNGFQNSDVHDSIPMKDYFDQQFKKEYENCEVICVHLFFPADKKTHHHKKFEQALRKAIEEYIAKGYDIIIMGYSFSASLAAKMCRVYRKNITRAIFVAPVYDTILNHMIPGYIKYALKYQKLVKKYGAKMAKTMGRQTTAGLPGLLISIFSSILINRHYFRSVKCDTLLIRGSKDELCTEHSLKKVSSRIKGNMVRYTYPDFTHGILKTVHQNGVVYEDILHFCFNTPFLLERNILEVNSKKTQKQMVRLDEDGEPIPTFSQIFEELDPDAEEQTALDQEGL